MGRYGRAAGVQGGSDLKAARFLASALIVAQGCDCLSLIAKPPEQPSPEELERTATRDDAEGFYAGTEIVRTAHREGDVARMQRFAPDLLSRAASFKSDWNYGNAIHYGNLALGRAALAGGDVEAAKKYLRAAGDTPGSPQLNSFGPSMILAGELLARGEKDAVLQYLDQVELFWRDTSVGCFKVKGPSEYLATWRKDIAAGRTPDFRMQRY